MTIQNRAISALKWATAAKVVVQIASWAGTLVVVRLLTPEDYGLMAKVAVVCGIAGAIAELGLGAAIVRAVEMSEDDLRKISGVSLLVGALMTAVLIAAAPLLSWIFREPRLAWPIAGASLQILVGAIATIPTALWTRDLSFRRMSKIEMASGVSSIVVTLLLALLNTGVWALVLGTLFGAVVRTGALLALGRRVKPLFSLRGIGEHVKFGLTLVGNRVSYFVVVQADVLIGSAFLSTTEIGHYSVALQLATLPMSKVMGTLNQIALPLVAGQQRDPARLRQGVMTSMGLISLIAFPLLWGISALASELVRTLFGPNWIEAIPALAILPLAVPIRMLCSIMFTTSLALGNRQLDLRNTIINFVVVPGGFFVGAHWGLVGLCASWLVSLPLAYAFSMPGAMRSVGIRWRDMAAECGPPAAAAGVMYAAIAALRVPLTGQLAITALGTLSIAGAIVYVAVMAVISRRHLVNARRFAQSLYSVDVPRPS